MDQTHRTSATAAALVLIVSLVAGMALRAASEAQPTTRPAAGKARSTTQPASRPSKARPGEAPLLPCPATSRPTGSKPKGGRDEIPRFVVGSPFAKDYTKPTEKREKILWAKSCLWQKAPKLVVEKWLSPKPDTGGKYVLLEFWATWCPPCRKSISLLNGFHKKYGKDLVVIGLSDESEAAVRKLKKPKIEYFSAIDRAARMKNQLQVRGIPHVIIIEPSEGVVIWEGFPFLKGYDLTEDIIRKIVRIKPGTGK